MSAEARPNDYPPLSPMLAIRDAAAAVEFYKRAFGAVEVMRLQGPDGRLEHGEFQIGDALVMVAEEHPDYNRSPQTLGGTSVILNVYVPDVDALFERAVAAGAKVIFPLKNQFYGDRSGRLEDPYGHMWIFSTRVEEITREEMVRRFDEMVKGAS
jgi:PhnB protein